VFSRRAIFAFNTALVVARDGALRDARGLPHGATVGAVLGYEYSERFNRLARTGAIRLEFAGSEEVNVRKVVAGRLDAATVNVNAAKSVEYVARRAGVPGRLRALTVVEGLPAYIGFSRTHPDGARAMAAYEDGMSRIASNGTLARIDREWRRRDRAAAP
jgi:polar amino acid transport system substrate-binding protein